MKITFYNKTSDKYFSISHIHPFVNEENALWIENQNNEGMIVKIDEISDVIFDALERHFVENF
jgi:hypothetical protein